MHIWLICPDGAYASCAVTCRAESSGASPMVVVSQDPRFTSERRSWRSFAASMCRWRWVLPSDSAVLSNAPARYRTRRSHRVRDCVRGTDKDGFATPTGLASVVARSSFHSTAIASPCSRQRSSGTKIPRGSHQPPGRSFMQKTARSRASSRTEWEKRGGLRFCARLVALGS